jgi:signal transduction histidine kinase
MVAHLNMTAHKLLEEQALAANQEMSDFLDHFSHEARTPLASFDAYVQLARRRLERMRDEAQQGELAGDALDQRLADLQQTIEQAQAPARRLNRLIGDLAEVVQIRSGQLTLERVPCELVEIVKKAISEQQVSWPARQLHLRLQAQVVPILGDPDRIGEVVTNYLTNALKYAPPGRPIEVSVSTKAGWARVQVRDQGPGIPPDEQSRIWQRFYRSPSAHAQEGSGVSLGVGLYICRSIIAQHGGQTGVKSVAGRGATFWFTVPLVTMG